MDYKRPLVYGDTMIIETIFHDTPAAKIIFDFTIYKKGGDKKEVIATGQSIQVFLDKKNTLQLYNPPFYAAWKEKMHLGS